MLKDIVRNKTLSAKGIIGFYPASSVNDDIHIYDESRMDHKATFYGLRQQAQKVLLKLTPKEEAIDPYLCLSDFIAPASTHVKDYLGLFAVSVGFGVDEKCAEYLADHDDYNSIMLKSLADRLVSF